MSAPLHALIVGIDHYPNLRGKDLRGAVADARLMAALLADRFGLLPENTEVLLNEAATRDGLLAAFERLVARVGADEQVVIFYAGHGTRVATAEGGAIEAVVAHDSGRGDAPNRDVFDYEVDAVVQRLNEATPYVTLLFDCCHSGSVTRDLAIEGTREVEPEVRPVARGDGTRGTQPAPFVPGRRDTVLVAACQATELAAEYAQWQGESVVFHGALTWHLGEALTRVRGPATWRDVFEVVVPRMGGRFPRQHPQLEGRADLVVFGTEARPAGGALRVARVAGGEAVLAGGALHGVGVGSRWTLRDPLGGGVGDFTVAAVGATEARGPAPAGAEAGWRAEPVAHVLAAPTLAVAIEAPLPLVGVLAGALATSPLLRLARPGEPAVVAHGDAGSWHVLAEDGQPAVPVRAAGDEAALVADLARLARFRGLLGLENPNEDEDLRKGVTLDVLRVQGADVTRAEWVHADGLPAFEEGQQADFVVRNTTAVPVYVSLVEFGTDYGIRLVAPLAGHPTWRPGGLRLEPGDAISVAAYYREDRRFRRLGAGLPLHLPAGFPWTGGTAATGRLSMRLLVTRTPADFEFLSQPGTRTTGGHFLADLVSLYAAGPDHRSFVPEVDAEEAAGWSVVTRTLVVSRADGRQLDPGGSGKVLFYRLVVGTQQLGEVGITAPLMATLPGDTGFWQSLPTPLPKWFQLVPGDEISESLVGSRLGKTPLTSPPFEGTARPLAAPGGVLRSWRVQKGTTVVGYMAQTTGGLHWFGLLAGPRLPRATLTFVEQALPTAGAYYHAVDQAL